VQTLNVHLGCGKRHLPGFLHVDRDAYDHIDHVADISQLPFLASDSVDLIYCCHALEYFDRFEIPKVLGEWRRVLKKGGVLRLSVPDLDQVCRLYEMKRDPKLLYGFLYGHYAKGGATPIYHKMIFNFESMQEFLHEAGFQQVKRYDWRETIHKDHDDYSQAYFPHMDKDKGLLMSLNIEATKA
jgi:predicted SAM-dependent methyltransferase